MNILSILIKTLPDNIQKVLESLKSTNLCEIHLHDQLGQIIITIECDSSTEEIDKINAIKSLDHIISLDIMYYYSDNDLNNLRENIINSADDIPEILKKANLNAEDIKYNGNPNTFFNL